jgi:hypothetical protein
VAGLLVALAVLGGYVALQVRTHRAVRARRERYREHPEEFPSRRQRVLRILPFGLFVAGFTIFCAATGRTWFLPLGLVSTSAFAFLIYRVASGREDTDGS